MKCLFFSPVILLALASPCANANAHTPGQAPVRQELPKVEEILDREAEAMGGKAAQAVKTFVMKAKINVEDQQVELAVYHAGLKKQNLQISSEVMGRQEIVINGEKAWVKTSDGTISVLENDERTAAYQKAEEFSAIFQRVGNWRKDYKQVQFIAEERVDGKPVYKVAITTEKNESLTDYYDTKTGLLVQREATVEGPYGTVSVVASFSDFRTVDGITHAFTTRITGGPDEIVVTLESMSHNVDIPEERFALPAELK